MMNVSVLKKFWVKYEKMATKIIQLHLALQACDFTLQSVKMSHIKILSLF